MDESCEDPRNEDEQTFASSMPTSQLGEDSAAAAFNVGLNLIPGIGGAMSSAFNSSIAITDKRKQDRWLRGLASAVDELRCTTKLTYEDIVNDEAFVTAVVRGLRIIRETDRDAKLHIVTNAVCNSGSWAANDEAMQSFFMRLLERYEPEHVMFLAACDNPQQFIRDYASKVGNGQLHWIFANVIYEGNVQWEPLANLILQDVSRDQLVRSGGMGLGFPLSEEHLRVTSPTGHEFLGFCSKPSKGSPAPGPN